MVARNRDFTGLANLMVSLKFCSDDACCHGNENLELFLQKSCHNSACMGCPCEVLAPNRGFSGNSMPRYKISFVVNNCTSGS